MSDYLSTVVFAALVVAVLVVRRRRRSGAGDPAHAHRRKRRGALLAVIAVLGFQAVIGTPALAQDGCPQAPTPQRPGTGMVGAIDPPQGNGLAGGPYTDEQHPYPPYHDNAYAGMVWHIYDNSCGPLSSGFTDPGSTIDNWAGNQMFNIGKNVVGVTNSLHYTLQDGGVLGGLNEAIGDAAGSVFDNIYMQLFSVFMIILAVLLFRQIWRGDLSSVTKRAAFALGGIWLAASGTLIVYNFDVIDRFIVDTTTGISNGFTDAGRDPTRVERHVLPTELHTRVVYENWLRGEFGQPDSAQAEQFGRRLLDAQAWTRDDLLSGADADNAKEQAKKDAYKQIAADPALGPARGYFEGKDGNRTGSGLIAMVQSLCYALFQLFAKLGVLLAQLLLRIFALAAPVIGLVAIVHQDVLRRAGKAVGAVLLNVLILAALAGIHFKFLQLVFAPEAGMSLFLQVALAGIVTIVFLAVGRPMRRMRQMVELSVSATGAAMPTGGGLFSRFRKRSEEPSPQDEFWEHVRDTDLAEGSATAGPGGRRSRPEASHSVTATAQRMDRQNAAIGSGPTLLGPSSPSGLTGFRDDSGGAPVFVGGGGGGGRSGGAMLTGATSRLVDTAPVTDRSWDRGWGEDALVTASRPERPSPRPADTEVVAGRPVHIIYRPSRGLEVAENTAPRRMPLNNGPNTTDQVVR